MMTYQFPEHRFIWKILKRAPNKERKGKIHEAYYVMCLLPTLNNLFDTIPKRDHID